MDQNNVSKNIKKLTDCQRIYGRPFILKMPPAIHKCAAKSAFNKDKDVVFYGVSKKKVWFAAPGAKL